ncbi:TIM barrel protein [Enterococcus sp. 669A]|uniref:TIM barrel protein n=1 Tax=Candidatus Enterococcus moelleringii TaxID=2815325 RepID=A0ABS3L8G9_9ENTE|nr:TIM barrel protein [Enterococcus sp. 669A]MBO1305918.1 TIM barrel protein [Enterococcus sp. 669A]
MQESIHKYFDMGLIQWMSYPPQRYELLDTVTKVARDPFFNAIEMTQINDDSQREAARDLLAQSHMRVCYGAQPRLLGPGLNPNAIDEEDRLKAEKTLLEAIDEADYLGAKGIAFLAGKWAEETKEEAYEQLLKTTRNLCSYAAKKEMMVELEIFDYDMDKCSLIGPAPLAARFAGDVRLTHNNFGLIVDLSHFPTTYETSKYVIQCTKPYITHLHIGNNVVKEGCECYGDLHPRFGYPDSANDVPELLDFFQVLKNEGFLDERDPIVLSFEVQPRPHEDGDIIVANTKRVIERAWSLLED